MATKTSVLAILIAVLSFSSQAFAVSTQDFETIRSFSAQYLSEVPENGYHVSADDLLKRIGSGKNDFLIVDVREKAEKYKAGHIPGSIYINFKDVATPENLAKLPKDKDIILYCNTGHEEGKALTVLRLLGYRAFALKFGYVAWKKEKPTDAMLAVIDNAAKKNYPTEQ
jgi:rhodanese-related sulfurtransferase